MSNKSSDGHGSKIISMEVNISAIFISMRTVKSIGAGRSNGRPWTIVGVNDIFHGTWLWERQSV